VTQPVSRRARLTARAALVGALALGLAAPGVRASDDLSRPAALARSVLGQPQLAGQYTLRWFGMRVYDATLWSAGVSRLPTANAKALPVPFDRELLLELRYAMSLSGERIAERSDLEMGRQPERASAEQRAAWLAQMRALFPDVKAGDRLAAAYSPGARIRFWLNDRPLGEVTDPAFGPAFLGIWLDARTSEPSMRAALLRGVGPSESYSPGTNAGGVPAGAR
jgi:hypothetical protein